MVNKYTPAKTFVLHLPTVTPVSAKSTGDVGQCTYVQVLL